MFRFLAVCFLMTCVLIANNQAQRSKARRPAVSAEKTSGMSSGKRGPAQVVKLLTEAVPGQTFPAFSLDNIPETSFSCDQSSVHYAGYYADPETGCQCFHYCPIKEEGVPTVATTYLCPNYTIFDQRVLTCRWWYEVDCDQAVAAYDLANSRLYIPDAPLLDD